MMNIHKYNLLYLTWGEELDLNGLIGQQVFRQLINIKSLNNNLRISIVSGVPCLSKARAMRNNQRTKKCQEINSYLDNHGIKLTVKDIMVLPRWFYTIFYLTWLYYNFHLTYLRDYLLENKVDLIHCRSYHAVNLALMVKKKYRLPVKIIFDTRGLFPEEGVFKGWYGYDSLSYRIWKQRERELLNESDAIINVSYNFTNHIKSITENPNVFTIYTSVDLDTFYKDNDLRKKTRAQLGFSKSEKVLIYIGSIGISGWHRFETLISLYQAFKLYFIKTRLLVITQSPHKPIKDNFRGFGLTDNDFKLFASKSAEQTNSYLNAADYACLPSKENNNEIENIISHTMLASKTGEYFAGGLPILVNENVGEAAMLVERYNLGAVYKARQESVITDKLAAIENDYNKISNNCIGVAKKLFASEVNARKYLAIYNQLLNKDKTKEL